MKKEVVVIQTWNPDQFREDLESHLNDGWKIDHISSGVYFNNASEQSCAFFHAILIKVTVPKGSWKQS